MSKSKYTYCLRTCNADMTSYNGFRWPESGKVTAPDWNHEAQCGNGLHGLLMGEGDGWLLNWDKYAKWLVVKVEIDTIISLGDKVKMPQCEVVYCGDRKGATDFIIEKGADASKVVGAFLQGGYSATVTGGYHATVTGGDSATVTGGNHATVTGGDCAILQIKCWDKKHSRYRIATAYVGEDGIKSNTRYRCKNGEFVEVTITETKQEGNE